MTFPSDQKAVDAFFEKHGKKDESPAPPVSAPRNGHGGGRVHGYAPDIDNLIEILRRDPKRAALFDGSNEGHKSDSEADAALFHHVAFYADKDPQVMEEIARRSARNRAKWNEPRRGTTWLRWELQKVADRVIDTYTSPGKPIIHNPQEGGEVYFHHIDGGFDGNKQTLPIKSVEEVISEAGEEVPWIIENVLARGELTEFSGLAKRGGKTTFWCHAIAAGARGDNHAGFYTESAKYLYLTEQGNNFAQALRESGLEKYPDRVSIVQFKDVSGTGWDTLIQQAGQAAKNGGYDVLVVDTFAVFARLKGSEENDSGPVADRMRVLRLVAQKYNIAVVLIRHAGKDGTPRGSSAFEAEADICVTLSRPEGRHAPSVRRIAGIGRHGEWERNIQLQDGRFVSLGTDNRIEFTKAVRFIKAVLPETPDTGAKKSDLLDKREGDDGEISAATFDRALAWLVKQGEVGERQEMNQRGKPKVYWRAYNPDEGLFPSNPRSGGGNKSETPVSVAGDDDEEEWF